MAAKYRPEAYDRLCNYLDEIGALMRDKRQRASFAIYAIGLLNEGDRKSMEPIAARVGGDPESTVVVHNQLMRLLSSDAWHDEPIRAFATNYAIEAMQSQAPVNTWIVDDTGMLKQGKCSPAVQRQYTGSAGKTANCQIAVSLVFANGLSQVIADARLYLPESWAADRERCRRAHIPDDVEYAPKWALALEMIEQAVNAGAPKGVVLADCDYGNKTVFRDTLARLGLKYAVEIQSTTKVRRVGTRDVPGERIAVGDIGRRIRKKVRKVTWRDGTNCVLHSRFARLRVIVDREDNIEREPEWLLIEWPEGEAGPTKFVLSTLPKTTSCKQLVRTFKERWRIERSYEDVKGELGFDHYEGRSFVGWHHHVTTVLVCYAFLVAETVRSFPPSTIRQSDGHAIESAA
jgi:SRSO17 transposase